MMLAVFSVGPLRGYATRPTVFVQRVSAVQLRVQVWSVDQRATEIEASALVRFITRTRVVKTLQRNSHYGELLPRKD
jgi:hypothetical protein